MLERGEEEKKSGGNPRPKAPNGLELQQASNRLFPSSSLLPRPDLFDLLLI